MNDLCRKKTSIDILNPTLTDPKKEQDSTQRTFIGCLLHISGTKKVLSAHWIRPCSLGTQSMWQTDEETQSHNTML